MKMGGAPEQFTPIPIAVTNYASALPRGPLLVWRAEQSHRKRRDCLRQCLLNPMARKQRLKRLKRRSKTLSSWDAVEHRLAAGSEGCIVSARDGSVESAFRNLGRCAHRSGCFRSHHVSSCSLRLGVTHLRAFCAVYQRYQHRQNSLPCGRKLVKVFCCNKLRHCSGGTGR
jgi:hypothetical protein